MSQGSLVARLNGCHAMIDYMQYVFDFDGVDITCEETPLCLCGCKASVCKRSDGKGWRRYIRGHFTKRPPPPLFSEAPDCACGCQMPVTWNIYKYRWNIYIKNHHTKLHPIGEPPLCACGCKQPVSWNRRKKCWCRCVIGHNARLDWANDEFANRVRCIRRSDASREKYRQAAFKRWDDESFREKMRNLMANAQYRDIHKQNTTANWQNRDFVDKVMIGRANSFKNPNKLEAYFDKITPMNVVYTGGGTFWITLPNGRHKNPDFIIRPIRETRKCIEIFGDFWHKDDDPFDLIEMYWRKNFECLLFWEHQIYDDPIGVVEQVLRFVCNGEGLLVDEARDLENLYGGR